MAFRYQYLSLTQSSEPSAIEWEFKKNETSYNYVSKGPVDPALLVALVNEAIKSGAGTSPSSSRPSGFFGWWRYRADPGSEKPEPSKADINVEIKPSNPSYFKSKKTGEIVISPCRLIKGSITSDPVPVEGGDTLAGSDQVTNGDFPEKWAPMPFPRTNAYPVLINGRYYTFRVGKQVRSVTGKGWDVAVLTPEFFDRWSASPLVDGAVVTDAMNKLNEATLDLLTELAEFPEVIGMARDTLGLFKNRGRRLHKLIKEVRDELGGGRSLAHLGDKIANIRLLYRYGILPLTYTLKDIKKVLKESFRRSYCKGSSKKEDQLDMTFLGWTFEGVHDQTDRCSLKRRLDPDSSVQQFQAVFGINVPLTLWELTPWSLVVDWFVNVGDYLTAVNVYPSLQEVCTYSTRRRIVGTYTNSANSKLKIRVEFDLYDRIVVPKPADHICLSFNPLLTADRKMDALAFSWQVLRKSIKNFKH